MRLRAGGPLLKPKGFLNFLPLLRAAAMEAT